MPKVSKTKRVKEEKVDWHQVIALSAAGLYIQNRLKEQLDKIPSPHKKSSKKK